MKWWLPAQVVFVEEIPHAATGKVSKRLLRLEMREGELAVTGAA